MQHFYRNFKLALLSSFFFIVLVPVLVAEPKALYSTKHQRYQFYFSWINGPSVEGLSSAHLELVPKAGQDVTALKVLSVKPRMDAMGHGSDREVTVRLSAIDPALYELSNISFTMGGVWQIYVYIQKGQDHGSLDVAMFEVEL